MRTPAPATNSGSQERVEKALAKKLKHLSPDQWNKELAGILGYNASSVGKIRKNGSWQLVQLRAIAQALGVNFAWLAYGEGPMEEAIPFQIHELMDMLSTDPHQFLEDVARGPLNEAREVLKIWCQTAAEDNDGELTVQQQQFYASQEQELSSIEAELTEILLKLPLQQSYGASVGELKIVYGLAVQQPDFDLERLAPSSSVAANLLKDSSRHRTFSNIVARVKGLHCRLQQIEGFAGDLEQSNSLIQSQFEALGLPVDNHELLSDAEKLNHYRSGGSSEDLRRLFIAKISDTEVPTTDNSHSYQPMTVN